MVYLNDEDFARIAATSNIRITSGEGTGSGTTVFANGIRTLRGLKSRLRRERCGGDRWAYATIDYNNERIRIDV